MPVEPAPLPPLLSLPALARWIVSFGLVLWIAHHLVLFTFRYVDFDCPPHWPFSIYNPRGPHGIVVYTALAATVLTGMWALRRLSRRGWPTSEVVIFGLALVLLTNALQGVPKGFVNPIAGGRSGEQYYHDAQRVTGAADFLHDFKTRQPILRTHARTHPPGAVLLFYTLHYDFGFSPAAIAVLIAVFSVAGSAGAFRSVAQNLLDMDKQALDYGTFLLLLLPAVQIYYCATLDAVVATLLIIAAAFWLRPPTVLNTLLGTIAVTLASFLTFGFVWVLPILVLLDGKRAWWRVGILLFMIAAFYGLLHTLSGFDYILALRTASRLENPQGFRLLHEPISFAFTRLEDVTEMLAFFGPVLIALLWQSLPVLRREQKHAWQIVMAAAGMLAALFLTGAYHTGETARACVFLYPYLLLPIVYLLRDTRRCRDRIVVAALVLTQTIVMQTWGNWFW